MLHNGPPLWSQKFEKSNLSLIQPSQVVVPHSNVWVLFSEDLFANSNRFVPKRLSLTVLTLTKKKCSITARRYGAKSDQNFDLGFIDSSQVVEESSNVRVVISKHFFED